MMQEEFEARFGMEVSGEVYRRVEALYMQSSDDKDSFVRKLKRQNTVVKIQDDIIREQEGKLSAVRAFIERQKANADEIYARDKIRAGHDSAVKKIGEGTLEYYAWNNYSMSLAETVLCSNVLEIIS